MRAKKLDYQATITADDPVVRYASPQARHDLDQWLQIHGTKANDCTSLTVTAWTDGSGEVEMECVVRGPDRLPVKDDSGMFLKRKTIKSPLLAPLPNTVRTYAK